MLLAWGNISWFLSGEREDIFDILGWSERLFLYFLLYFHIAIIVVTDSVYFCYYCSHCCCEWSSMQIVFFAQWNATQEQIKFFEF